MATTYTTLLGYALPTTGELDGLWGTEVNDSITQLVEDSVANYATASVAASDWTLSTTGSGVSNEARMAILIPTGSPGVSRNIIAPSHSKMYVVINQSNAAVVVKGAATTGVSIATGKTALVAWNGTDFVEVSPSTATTATNLAGGVASQIPYQSSAGNTSFISNGTSGQVLVSAGTSAPGFSSNLNGITIGNTTPAAGTFTSVTDSGLTSGRVTYASTSGLLTDNAALTFDGTTLSATKFAGALNGTVGATTPNTGAFTTLSASSTVSGTGFSTYLASPPAIGGTTAAAGSFTTLSASGTTTLSGGTANSIAYLNGSKVVSTSSNFTYDGTNVNLIGNFHCPGGGNIPSNEAFGDGALESNTSGIYSSAIGSGALFSNTTGSWNSAIGASALYYNTTGDYNSAVGMQTLTNNTTGLCNSAIGAFALNDNTTSSYNSAVGYTALFKNNGGIYNSAVGMQTLTNNTTGSYNSAIGANALYSNTTGSGNSGVGMQTLTNNTTGSYNSAIGYNALTNNTTGNGNTAINPLNSAGTYAPVFDPTSQSNRFCMGSTSVTNAYIQVAWTVVSDARDKTDFAPVPYGLDFVNRLKPTAYRYKIDRAATEGHGPVRYGFKAQDVLAEEGDTPVIVDAEDADKLRFNDQSLIAVLVNAIQELSAKVDSQAAEIAVLKGK